MLLYFLRHGEAGTGGGMGDDARRLTDAGRAALRAAVPLWRRLNLRPDLVLSSPLPRALETAEIVCDGLGLRPPVVDERLRPGADWGGFARAMAEGGDARRVLFVGHEPDLSSAVAQLTGASSIRMRKGGLACVEFYGVPEPGSGELAWLLDPDLYSTAPPDAGEIQYRTRVAAYALAVDDDRLLLARIAPGYTSRYDGWWTLPGGGIDFGEHPRDGALRELTEETGLMGEVVGLADVLSWRSRWTTPDGVDEDFHGIQIIYRVRVTGGELRDETGGSSDACRWLTREEADALPIVELAEHGLRLAFGPSR